jgi:hypothetical protein
MEFIVDRTAEGAVDPKGVVWGRRGQFLGVKVSGLSFSGCKKLGPDV